jgi:hypothetical protein
MPTTSGETFYDLAIRAIEEQEREVNGLRGRTGTIVAAAAVAATLLAREVFAGAHPNGWLAWTATSTGLIALAAVLLSSVYLLRSHDLRFSLDAAATLEDTTRKGFDPEDPAELWEGLTYVLSSLQARNGLTVGKLRTAFALALGGLLVEVVGLGLGAALA